MGLEGELTPFLRHPLLGQARILGVSAPLQSTSTLRFNRRRHYPGWERGVRKGGEQGENDLWRKSDTQHEKAYSSCFTFISTAHCSIPRAGMVGNHRRERGKEGCTVVWASDAESVSWRGRRRRSRSPFCLTIPCPLIRLRRRFSIPRRRREGLRRSRSNSTWPRSGPSGAPGAGA